MSNFVDKLKKALNNIKQKAQENKRKNQDKPKKDVFKKVKNLFSEKEFVDVNDNYRVQIKIIQRQSNLIGIQYLIIIFLMLLLVGLQPLKQKVPYFLTFMPKDEQIVYVEPYKTTVSQQRIEKEYLARNYVKLRETIDLVDDEDRYSTLLYYSTPEVVEEFNSLMNPDNNPDSAYKYATDNNLVSSVSIVSSNMLNDNQYQVDFIVIQSNQLTKKKTKTTKYIATVSFVNPEKTFKGEDHLNNPLGYRVSNYQVSIKSEKIQSNLENKDDKKGNNNSNSGVNW